MTATLVAAGLATLCVLVVLLPFANPLQQARALPDTAPHSDRSRELLRQLRDLDEDLAAGKLDHEDHSRMRGPVERQAALELRRLKVTSVKHSRTEAPLPVEVPQRRRHRLGWVAIPVGAVAVAAVALLIAGALVPRGTGRGVTGGTAAVSSPQTSAPTPAPRGSAKPGPAQLTPAQLSGVNTALAEVRKAPKNVGAHLDLARAYAGAGSPQLSAIEYLAVTQLDPGNASANTQLALIAFEAGQAQQAKKLVDSALNAHPRYPEALYARGLIQLMGLGDLAAGKRDLAAYLVAAPHGSHRVSVATLLAIASGPSK